MNKVSIIVAMYNPEWNKIRVTLESILKQKGIVFEIIIADDGSKYNFEKEIIELFERFNFKKYKLSMLTHNVGTCKNIYNAIIMSNSKYIKTISPGDFLYDENTLKNWVNFMEIEKPDISFGDYINYNIENNKLNIISTINHPSRKNLFNKKSNRLFINYMVLYDLIIGAVLLAKSEVMEKYISMIIDKVIYTEDHFVRLALYEDSIIKYYSEPVMYYELGTGISTSGEEKWSKLMGLDNIAANEIIVNECESSTLLSKKYRIYLKTLGSRTEKLFKYLLFPEIVRIKYKEKIFYTSNQCDENSFVKLLLDKE